MRWILRGIFSLWSPCRERCKALLLRPVAKRPFLFYQDGNGGGARGLSSLQILMPSCDELESYWERLGAILT